MDTPNHFLLDPARPGAFRLTRKGRDALGPRFARRGFDLYALRTADAIDDAVAAVILAELRDLAPERRTDRDAVNRIFDLQFATDPLRGVPPLPLERRREARRRVVREIARPHPPPPAGPAETASDALRRWVREGVAALRSLLARGR